MAKNLLKIFFGLLLAMLWGADAMAEPREYHEEALYGLKGNVREVKTSSKSYLPLRNSFKFKDDGRMTSSVLTYDEEGYPMGYNVTMGNSVMDCKVEWNDNRTPKSISDLSTSWPTKGSKNIEFFYGEDEFLPVKAVAVSQNGKKTKTTTVVCEYSDYELDEKGNWISRNVSETVTELKQKKNGKEEEKEKSSSFTETRTIVY